jgi:hypothetical protein
MPRLLSLFDGTGSISRAFAGWDVQSLDIDGSHGASVVGDILTWDYHLEPTPDVLFAGCPCEHYSIANTRGKRNLTFADRLVARTWEVIQHFVCSWFFKLFSQPFAKWTKFAPRKLFGTMRRLFTYTPTNHTVLYTLPNVPEQRTH